MMNAANLTIPEWFATRLLNSAFVMDSVTSSQQPPGWMAKRTARDKYSLYLCQQGTLDLRIGSQLLMLEPGDVALINPSQPFSDGDREETGTTFLVADFMLQSQDGLDPLALLDLPQAFRLTNLEYWIQRCSLISPSFLATRPEYRLVARPLLDELLVQFVKAGCARNAFPLLSDEALPSWIWPLLERLERELENPALSNEDLARWAGLSPTHFNRVFSTALSIPPMRWVQKRRMMRACRMLARHPQLSVREVSMQCGYEDPFHFSRRFKKLMGCSPRHWRKRRGMAELQRVPGSVQVPKVLTASS